MTVTVSDEIWEVNHRDPEGIQVAFLTSAPIPDAVAALSDASEAAVQEIDEEGGIDAAIPVPGGAGIYIHDYDFEFEGVIAALVRGLQSAGLSGELAHFKTDLPTTRGEADLLECSLSLRGTCAIGLFRIWTVEPEALKATVDLAVDWCSVPDERGTLFLMSNMFSYALDADQARAWFPLALQGDSYPQLCWASGSELRIVHFNRDAARLSFLAGTAVLVGSRWRDILNEMRGLLVAAAPWAIYGAVKQRSHTSGSPGIETLKDWVETPHLKLVSSSAVLRQLEERYVPDAFGLQLLSTVHAARAPDGDPWSVTTLDHGSLLVQHRDLEAWYSSRLPDTEVLEEARRDFSELLMTKEIVETERARSR